MTHSPSVDPADLPATFAAAFNSRSATAVDACYEPGGVFVPAPGRSTTGRARAAANDEFLALGLPISVRPRHTYVADDVALLIVDWHLVGADVSGTATDVARRGADGRWRYVIDNPFGTAFGTAQA